MVAAEARGQAVEAVRRVIGAIGANEMAQIAPSPTNTVEGARTFGWQYATENLPAALCGTSLFHSGWSGQTVLFDLKSRRFAVVITVRSGDYKRAKRERFVAIGALLRKTTEQRD